MAHLIEKNGTELTVRLQHELNSITAKELDALLNAELMGVQSLTLDFEHCDYVSSAGIRVLLAARKRMSKEKGTLRLIHVGEFLQALFQDVGLDVIFDIQ